MARLLKILYCSDEVARVKRGLALSHQGLYLGRSRLRKSVCNRKTHQHYQKQSHSKEFVANVAFRPTRIHLKTRACTACIL